MKSYKIYMETDDRKIEIEVTKEIKEDSETIFMFYTDTNVLPMAVSKKLPKEPHKLLKYFLDNQTSKYLKVNI